MKAPLPRTRIVRASETFKISRHHVPGFPLVLDADGALVEPIFAFLRAEAVRRHLAPGTLLDEAYVLVEWWEFVRHHGNHHINLDSIIEWTGRELERLRCGGPAARSKRRISRCLDVVGRFHTFLLNERACTAGVQAWRSEPYLKRLDPRLADSAHSKITFAYSARRKNGGRPTPTEEQVERVLDVLSEGAAPHLNARNWLMARWMRDVGLRRAGVASLKVEALRAALIGEGILRPHEFFVASGTTSRSRIEVRAAIEDFRATGRTFVSAVVTEKGDKTRGIKIPFGLLHQTLDFMWSDRLKVAPRAPALSGHLWLSAKTQRGLSPKAVGDIVKKGFTAADVPGSGHRLRACFAEEVVFRLYALAKERCGIAFDENQVLIDAAEELGHSDWRGLRHYLNHAARNYAALNRAIRTG